MGNEASKRIKETPLVAQSRFPRAINTRFCLDHVTTLRLQEGFWSHTGEHALDIIDVGTLRVLFKIPPRPNYPPPEYKQVLLDRLNVPVAVMDAYDVGYEYAMYVPSLPVRKKAAGEPAWNPRHALCFFEMNNRPLENRLRIELTDPLTGGVIGIHVEGSWRTHHALMMLERGDPNHRECIARVYHDPEVKQERRSSGSDRTRYWVDIAAGVDHAMIVLACAALDEELAKKESKQPIAIGTDEVTKLMAQRHRNIRFR